MSKVSVFKQEWLDLVFEGRNKTYGAYQLRQQDSKTTLIALFSGVALLGALVSVPVITNYLKPEVAAHDAPFVLPDIERITPVELPERAKPIVTETAAAAPKPKENTIKFTTPEATSEPVVTDTPKTPDLNNTNPGSHTTQGSGGGIDLGPTSSNGPDEGPGTSPAGTDGTENGPVILAALDVKPEFPGGLDAFKRAVISKFNVPDIDELVTVKVYVSFIVETDGTMTDIKVAGNPGYNLGNEALKALHSIKKKWKPGYKKGSPVRTAYTLPILVRIN